MQATLSKVPCTSIEQAIHDIQALDFTNVINKLVNVFGWLKEDALSTAKLYQNYLILKIKYGKEHLYLPPSEDIDEFWHNHILDTERYIEDCQRIFGAYLHHYPYLGIDGKTNLEDLNSAYEVTQALHFKEFGYYIDPIRSKYPKFLYSLLKKIEIKFPSLL